MADLEEVRRVLHDAYKDVGKTGYPMKNCFVGQRKGGDITIKYQCAKEGGKLIGQK
jgi:hypothetical protein